MPRVVAIVDTNLYRSTSERVIEDLRWLEVRAEVRPMASFHATTELLAHVASAADPDYRSSRAALRRLWQHCAVYTVTHSFVAFAADPNGLLAKTLFDRSVGWGDQLADIMSSLIKRVALRKADEPTDDLANDLGVVRRFRDDNESRFTIMLTDIRRQLGLDKNMPSDFAPSERPAHRTFLQSGHLRSLAAYALVMNCAVELRIRLDHERINRLAEILEPSIPTALAVFQSAIEKVVSSGAAPSKQANSLWDLHLALFAAESMRVDGHPVIVVTEDVAVRRAAAATNASERVLGLDAYRAFLLSRLVA